MNQFIQIRGEYNPNTDLFAIANQKVNNKLDYITHLGIQSKKGNSFNINKNEFLINRTGILEIQDKITSLENNNEINKDTLIDLIVITKEV